MGDAGFDDRTFAEFPSLLRAGDVLVLNETRVVRARLHALRDGGGEAELLLLRPHAHAAYDPSAREWLALVRPGRNCCPLPARQAPSARYANPSTARSVRSDAICRVTSAIKLFTTLM